VFPLVIIDGWVAGKTSALKEPHSCNPYRFSFRNVKGEGESQGESINTHLPGKMAVKWKCQ